MHIKHPGLCTLPLAGISTCNIYYSFTYVVGQTHTHTHGCTHARAHTHTNINQPDEDSDENGPGVRAANRLETALGHIEGVGQVPEGAGYLFLHLHPSDDHRGCNLLNNKLVQFSEKETFTHHCALQRCVSSIHSRCILLSQRL